MKPLALKYLRRHLTIRRDENGVPHVDASNWLDALYGLGYLHAMDRGTQILFGHSVAAGRAAEQISNDPELLETDRFFRKFGLPLRLNDEVRALSDRTFSQLTSYCEGVNDGLKELGRSLPMWATGYEAHPWNQRSVLLIGKLLSFGGLAVGQMQNERLVMELIHAGVNDAALRELFSPRLDEVDFALLRQVRISNQLSDEALELITDLPRLAGSNAWAVSPRRSATGRTLLAADPHLEINRLPAIWYEAVLRWDGHYVMGASLPGCPLFAVARTERLAWGVTYMRGDTVDYFVEDCRQSPTGAWQYRRGEDWHDFRVRMEEIGRKGAQPEVLRCYENDQGVLDSDPEATGAGYHLSVAWTGNCVGSGQAIGTWLDVIAANDVKQGMDVVKRCSQPTLVWVFADRDGHIGLQSSGRFPQRGKGYTGFVPIPAWDERNHWQGWISPNVLPGCYDPPAGYVASANEEMNPIGGPLLVTQPSPDYRKRRICEVLESLPSATIQDMQSLQYDVISIQAKDVLNIVLPHLPESQMKARLQAWDYNFAPESLEATLFFRLYRAVMVQMLGHDQGIGWRRILYLCSRAGYSTMVMTAADRLLGHNESVWWSGCDKGELIRQAAAQVQDDDDVAWSEVNNFHFTDRFFGNHQVGRMLGYNSGNYPMPGCHATPFQGHVLQTAKRESTFAPSYHFVTDMGTDEALTNLPGGPSENRFSKLYKCDVPRWMKAEYKSLRCQP